MCTAEQSSPQHVKFRSHAAHKPHTGLDPNRASTGVIWYWHPCSSRGKILKNNRCTEQATEHGFIDQPHLWANLGQGAPEVDDEIEGSFPRPTSIPISVNAREYGPTAGIKPLREAIAKLYNDNYRKGKESQYTWENVCVVPGGRAGLIRIAAVLGNAYVGFFIPDYTAYNEMLGLFKNVSVPPSPKASMDTLTL